MATTVPEAIVSRTCIECSKEFRTKQSRRKCSVCRNRTACPKCGGPKKNASMVCRNCATQANEHNNAWGGGRAVHRKGYVMRRIKGRYVFEHVLVMEQLLARKLLKGETVHHKNGVKDDNRPENLELWVKPQPSGVRTEDAVAWAREILRRYSPEDLAA